MVRTLWDSITDFIAGGDDRTAALQEGIRENVTPFVPPNLREPLGLLAEMNPVQDMYRAGGNMRAGNYVDAGVDTAIAAAPIVGGVLGRVGANQLADTGGDAARAAMDTLLGGAPAREGADVAARGFLADEAGAINLWHGSPYDFDSFDLARVGSGEGAQDLGRGFSLTNEEAIAHLYTNPASRWGDLEAMQRYSQAGPGRYYNVLVDAEPNEFLDWNKPWRDQVSEDTPLFDALKDQEKRLLETYGDDPAMVDAIPKAKLGQVWRDNKGLEDAATQSGYVGNTRQNYSGDTEYTVFDPERMKVAKKFDKEGNEIALAQPTPAQNVATLLREGRADEVTDDMLGALTPNDEMELFDLYQRGATGVDMPMDEASRMARAGEMGFDVGARRFHGGDADIVAVNPDLGAGERYRTGFFSSNNPDVADSYASTQGGRVLPVVARRNDAGASIDVQGGNWRNIGPNAPAKIPNSVLADEFPELADGTTAFDVAPDIYQDLFNEGTTTNALARQRRFEGDSNITFANIVDRGPNIKRYLGETRADQMAREASSSQPSNIRVDFYGNQVRSPFARFDPRLANLRNLSAGIGGAGLLATQPTEQEREDEIRQYLGGLL